MTDQHTFESPEYTQDELIAALQKLGAVQSQDFQTPHFSYHGFEWCEPHEIHAYLRTDESAWMAMDDVLAKEYGNMGFSHIIESGLLPTNKWIYCVAGFWGRHQVVRMNAKAETVQAAVYSVFMQFIREELKK